MRRNICWKRRDLVCLKRSGMAREKIRTNLAGGEGINWALHLRLNQPLHPIFSLSMHMDLIHSQTNAHNMSYSLNHAGSWSDQPNTSPNPPHTPHLSNVAPSNTTSHLPSSLHVSYVDKLVQSMQLTSTQKECLMMFYQVWLHFRPASFRFTPLIATHSIPVRILRRFGWISSSHRACDTAVCYCLCACGWEPDYSVSQDHAWRCGACEEWQQQRAGSVWHVQRLVYLFGGLVQVHSWIDGVHVFILVCIK